MLLTLRGLSAACPQVQTVLTPVALCKSPACHITYYVYATCFLQVLELFKAADKYDVPGLVKECVQIFRKLTQSADVAPLLQVSWGC